MLSYKNADFAQTYLLANLGKEKALFEMCITLQF